MRVLELEEALFETYTTDAHCALYLPPEGSESYRIQKSFAESLEYVPALEVFFADCDNPNHGEWTEETLQKSISQITPKLENLGVYYTSRGFRVMQTLAKPLPFYAAEINLRRWLYELESRGFNPDWACTDWTRFFRLPNVMRDGKPFRSPHIDISQMEDLIIDTSRVLAPERRPAEVLSLITEWPDELPDRYKEIVSVIANSIKSIHDVWHELFLPISGSLHKYGIPKEYLPLMCKQIAIEAGDSRAQDRYNIGKTTAINILNRRSVLGFSYLRNKYPTVAEALDSAFKGTTSNVVSSDSITVHEASNRVRDIILETKYISIIKATTGLGKTHSAMEVAIARSRLGLKTAISVDKNNLAIQIQTDISAKGVDTLRIFGSQSVTNVFGQPECRYHEEAEALVQGGQSIYYELCRGRERSVCEYFEDCDAKNRSEGKESANIIIGTHAKINELYDFVGPLGMIIVDEPKSAIENHSISKEELKYLNANLNLFEPWYQWAVTPYLAKLNAWIDKDLSFETLTSEIDLSNLFGEESVHKYPPYKYAEVQLSKKKKELFKIVGKCSKILNILYRAKTEVSYVTLEDDERILITLYNQEFVKILKSPRPKVILDANADIVKKFIEKILGQNLDDWYYQYNIKDNCKVDRTVIKIAGATRSNWIYNGKPEFELISGKRSRETGLKDVFNWIAEWHEPGKSIGIVTFKPIAELIRRKDNRIPEEFLKLNPVVGHYYSLRGLNSMMNLDELVTVGDPFKNIDAITREMFFANIDQSVDEEGIIVAKAELEQAFGRLRVVRRSQDARMLHIGLIIPGGFGWQQSNQVVRPRRLGGSVMRADEMSLIMSEKDLNQTELAKLLDVPRYSINRYVSGKRTIPHDVAMKLIDLK